MPLPKTQTKMSNTLTGTDLLRAILQAELEAVNAEIRANGLREKYAQETTEFTKGEIVEVLREYSEPKWHRAKVLNYKFRTDPLGVVYTVGLAHNDGWGGGNVNASGAGIRKINDQ
jgi:hypothetical protein